MRNVFKFIIILTAVVALFACSKKEGTGKAADSSPVLAVVNGDPITVEDFREEAATLSPVAVRALQEDNNKDKFLDNLVDKQLIVQKAESMGLEKDPEVTKRMQRVKDTLLLGLFVKDEVLDKVKVTDQDVKDYFDKNKNNMGEVRISHILVASQPEAQDILNKLKAGGDFAKLAKEYSLDTKTKNSGGDLGYIKWEQFGSASLKDAAFKLNPGEVSGIIQSQFGYHIMKVTDKKPATDAQFAAMKDQLRELVAEKKKEDMFDSIVKGLKEKAKITKNEEGLKTINLGGPQPGMPMAQPAPGAPAGAPAAH
ncbi:MAG: peptidylprolyl isomerase [Nitrospirota bacterium]